MQKVNSSLAHEFVEFIPSDIELGKLYISIPYATAVHKCCCGCGSEVVTPLSPTDWSLTFDGQTISLSPSIGNWSFKCKSHYWIKRNKISWAEAWTEDTINLNREADKSKKLQSFGTNKKAPKEAVASKNHIRNRTPIRSALRKLWPF